MTRWFYLSLLVTVAAFAGSWYVFEHRWNDLPDRIPIHWNIHGQPDGFVPKTDAFSTFLLMPAIMAAIQVMTLVLPWLSPRHFKIEPFLNIYGYVMMVVTVLMGYIHAIMLGGSLVQELPVDRLMIGGLCFFFVLIGSVMGKVRRNFWMGVRTPWTLASEEVWDRTHRLTAWLFSAGGVSGMLIALLGLPLWLAFVGIIAAALVPVLYSLVLYKSLERQGKV
jgi:uncharacterized membrane protein